MIQQSSKIREERQDDATQAAKAERENHYDVDIRLNRAMLTSTLRGGLMTAHRTRKVCARVWITSLNP